MTITMAKRRRAPATAGAALPLAAPVAMLALLMAPSCRADWKVVPSVELRETYTDNVRLETAALAHSEFITDLAPSLLIVNEGPRLKLNAAFTSHLYRYSDNQVAGNNRSQRQLDAHAKAKLVEDLLLFDGSASIAQRAISAFGPQLANNPYSNTNRADVSSYRLSPYLVHRFGNAANAELRYARDSVKSGNIGFGDSVGDTVSMNIASGAAYRTLGWGLQASEQHLDSTRGGKSTAENASTNLRWRLAESFSLTGAGGYDKYDYQSTGGKTAGASYSLGFTWTPSLRTSLQASAGQRYYGASYALNASHRSRSTVWSLNYNDAVTTAREQFLLPATVDTAALLDRLFSANIADPVARRQAVDAYLRTTGLPASLADNVNYFSNRFLLQRQLQAAAAFNTAKTTTVLSLNATRRTALSVQESDSALAGINPASLNDNTRQAVAALSLNYRLSPRSGVNLVASSTRSESLATGVKSTARLVSAALTRQLQPKLKAAVELHRAEGDTLTLGGRTYRENALSASLSLAL
ncbi:MAG: TIGR03016 family PEP-CTERM system-associated outer membrane protein [Pseudomonadota bacterium]|nr:TIGR03016 family PEP-CTERM system-associated outer membrane protein [Pseudomonadota bacterium]MDL2354166.1 TIGR03016 family PEP-CTERM system-associated outer membrane protein [Pseudomonadota bacterium]